MAARVLGAVLAGVGLLGVNLLCGVASAQVVQGSATPPPVTFSSPAPPPPSPAPVPQPPANPSPSTWTAEPDLFLAGPDTYAPRQKRPHRRAGLRRTRPIVSAYLPYASTASAPQAPVRDDAPEDPIAADESGFLRLEVEPDTAQVYVDGFFVGTVAEFSGMLAAGTHRLELREAGFETVVVDVKVVPNEVTTYHRSLRKSADEPKPLPAVRPSPKTIYIIPRCYAGDTPPRAEQLPAGCDVSQVRIIPGS